MINKGLPQIESVPNQTSSLNELQGKEEKKRAEHPDKPYTRSVHYTILPVHPPPLLIHCNLNKSTTNGT
jgi:hypothetical protein